MNPTLKQSDIDRLFNKRNLKKWVVKISLIEEKTGIFFGLNEIDVNRNEAQYFNIRSDKFDQEFSKLKYLIEYENYESGFDDTEFIRNI